MDGVLEGFEHELLKPNRHVEIWAHGSKGGVADPPGDPWYVVRGPGGRRRQDGGQGRIFEHSDGSYALLHAAIEAAPPGVDLKKEAWDLKPLDGWVKGQIVLLGDSAHATTRSRPWAHA